MSPFHSGQAPGYYLHLIERSNLSKPDAELVTRFIHDTQATRRITAIRSTKLAQTLASWKQFLKPEYGKAKRDDLFSAVALLNSSKYKRNTKNDHIRILKQFFFWMIKRKQTKIKKEELDEISAPGVDHEVTEAKELLTRDEVTEIIRSCKNLRDRALIAVTFESAGRISEIARLKWKDVEYTENGVINLTINDEKTKKKRYAPLLMSMEYLAAWRSSYPGTPGKKWRPETNNLMPSGDALIFIDSVTGGPMEYRSVAQQITRSAKKAGVTKRCNPHVFRKSRLTEMVRDQYSESVVKEVGWGNQSSQMMREYIRLGSDDVMNEFLDKQGIKKHEKKSKDNLPVQCNYCLAMNNPTDGFCRICGKALTEKAQKQQDTVMDKLIALLKELPAEKRADLAKNL
jgi:site-specific recombinase XerD